jgi:5-methylcytosine-specific restriction enzyme A
VIRHLCRAAGCLALVDAPRIFCPAHQGYEDARLKRESERATARWSRHHDAHPEWSALYHTARWRKLRAAHLKANPCCSRCPDTATNVDHIMPHRGDEALAFDPGNLQSLCDRCSAIKTREDRG